MESKEYFEKVMQDYNQHRNGRSLRKYCKDEAIDYDWVIKFKKTYPVRSTEKEEPAEGFIPLAVTEEPAPALEWSVEHLVLRSPKGDVLEIKSTSLFVVAELLHKMSQAMLHFTDRTKYFLNSHPTDMRKGCEGLANIVRTAMEHNPKNYNEAFIFYSKDYRKVKILHYDINGWVMYSKWFTDGKFLQPKFEECKKCHEISRQILTLLLSTSVQTKLAI